MMTIPKDLYTQEITSLIEYLIDEEDICSFDHLSSLHKNKLVAFAIRALDCDVELILSRQANSHLCNYLLSYDRDNEIELRDSIQKSAYEMFSPYYDQMISDIRDEKHLFWRRSA